MITKTLRGKLIWGPRAVTHSKKKRASERDRANRKQRKNKSNGANQLLAFSEPSRARLNCSLFSSSIHHNTNTYRSMGPFLVRLRSLRCAVEKGKGGGCNVWRLGTLNIRPGQIDDATGPTRSFARVSFLVSFFLSLKNQFKASRK